MTQEQLKLLVRYIQLKLDEHRMAESSDHGLAERVRASNVLDKLEARCDEPARDWSEDAADENGNYQNKCVECGEAFIGHKRRLLCKVCANSVDRIKQAERKEALDQILPSVLWPGRKIVTMCDKGHCLQSVPRNEMT